MREAKYHSRTAKVPEKYQVASRSTQRRTVRLLDAQRAQPIAVRAWAPSWRISAACLTAFEVGDAEAAVQTASRRLLLSSLATSCFDHVTSLLSSTASAREFQVCVSLTSRTGPLMPNYTRQSGNMLDSLPCDELENEVLTLSIPHHPMCGRWISSALYIHPTMQCSPQPVRQPAGTEATAAGFGKNLQSKGRNADLELALEL